MAKHYVLIMRKIQNLGMKQHIRFLPAILGFCMQHVGLSSQHACWSNSIWGLSSRISICWISWKWEKDVGCSIVMVPKVLDGLSWKIPSRNGWFRGSPHDLGNPPVDMWPFRANLPTECRATLEPWSLAQSSNHMHHGHHSSSHICIYIYTYNIKLCIYIYTYIYMYYMYIYI